MRASWIILVLAAWTLPLPWTAEAQAPRQDAVWARVASGPITLDGILDEPSWALAESVHVTYGVDAGIPGSGWKLETSGPLAAEPPGDRTRATLKFLVVGNQLYLGAVVPDSSIGGSFRFNRFDGFLMAIKDHNDPNFPKPPAEYMYTWWYPDPEVDPQPPGQLPSFWGRWAEWPPGTPRTAEQIANWDAATVVQGLSNSDATLDAKYTVEMRFNLTPMGYDVTRSEGDIVEWNISIYDCDWFWPAITKFHANRVWWQGPWGNDMWYNEVRVHSRPDVTVGSGPPPLIEPELVINEIPFATPVMDGHLDEPFWSSPLVYEFDIRYGDLALRSTYPAVGRYRAGQYQPTVGGVQAAVLDPADATVKMFFKDNRLYMGFDVRDQVVQFHPAFDRWDGFIVTINNYSARAPDKQLLSQRLTFQVGPTGVAVAQDSLPALITKGKAQVAMALVPPTTVDTVGASPDVGYTAEFWVDLTGLGYPPGLGDHRLLVGVNHLDGDSFIPTTFSYGTRTWWFRQYEGTCCPAWAHLREIPSTGIDPEPGIPNGFALLGTGPNPGTRQQVRFALASPSLVTFEVFDVAGRLVESRPLGLLIEGVREVAFDGRNVSRGIYFFRVDIRDPESGARRAALQGRMIVVD